MPVDAGHGFYFIEVILKCQSSAIGACGPIICFYIPLVKNALNAIDLLGICIELIEAVFVAHVPQNQQEAGHAKGQSKNINKGKQLVFEQLSKGD